MTTTTHSAYTRQRLAQAGLTIISASAGRGDWVMGPPDTYGRLVGITAAGSAVVAWARDNTCFCTRCHTCKSTCDNFAAKCAAFDKRCEASLAARVRRLLSEGA